jgi:hypothetical protein
MVYSVFLFFVCEATSRILGFSPWKVKKDREETIVVHEPDPVLGWRNKVGKYLIPAFSKNTSNITFQVWPGGIRASQHSRPIKKNQSILVFGGSFTQGWAISDNQTFVWKLQERFQEYQFLNYGTGGFGTYQSLLLMERVLQDHSVKPKLVIYGFCGFHEDRNVASWAYLKGLTKMSFERRGHLEERVKIPYADIDSDGNISRFLPEPYRLLPFGQYSGFVKFIEHSYAMFKSWSRFKRKTQVTRKLILEMKSVAEGSGSIFIVAYLASPSINKYPYLNFFNKHGVRYIDCTPKIYGPSELAVPGEGHPSSILNSRWADCIEKAIKNIVP